MKLLYLAYLLASAAASINYSTDSNSPFVKVTRTSNLVIRSTPAVVYVLEDGALKRCLADDPNTCEVFQNGTVRSVVVVNSDYVYFYDGATIWRCESNKKQSCKKYYTPDSVVLSLAAKDYIYAGLQNGSILLCKDINSCQKLHTFVNRKAYSLRVISGSIYAGLDNGQVMQCSLSVENRCALIHDMGTYVNGVTNIGSTISAISWDKRLWNCSKTDTEITVSGTYAPYDCVSVVLNIDKPRAMQWFNNLLYVVNQFEGVYICNWATDPKCWKYADYNVIDIAFAPATYRIDYDVEEQTDY